MVSSYPLISLAKNCEIILKGCKTQIYNRQKSDFLTRHVMVKEFQCMWEWSDVSKWAISWQNQQNGMHTQQRLRSAWASTQSDQSSLCAQWIAKDPSFLHVDSEESDQTGRTPRLSESSLGTHAILLVLLWSGSNALWTMVPGHIEWEFVQIDGMIMLKLDVSEKQYKNLKWLWGTDWKFLHKSNCAVSQDLLSDAEHLSRMT